MKTSTFWIHVVAIFGGLALGLLIRSTMKPETVAIAPPHEGLSKSQESRNSRGIAHLLGVELGRKRTPRENAAVQHAILTSLPEDPHELLRQLYNAEGDYDADAIGALFTAWGESAPLEAIAAIESLPLNMRQWIKKCVMGSWVLIDTDGAFDYMNQTEPNLLEYLVEDQPSRRLSSLWHPLSRAYPEKALERAGMIDDLQERTKRENEILRVMSYDDPKAALAWIGKHREGEEQQKALAQIFNGWTRTDPEQALENLRDLNENLHSKALFKSVGSLLSLSGKSELAEEFIAQVPEKYRQDFMSAHVSSLARHDPARAAQSGATMKEGWPKEEAFYNTAQEWSFLDPIATAEWITTLPRSKSRDSAIAAFAHHISSNDPKVAMEWLLDMDDAGKKSSLLHNTLGRWFRADQAAATAWMDHQPEEILPESVKQRVKNQE